MLKVYAALGCEIVNKFFLVFTICFFEENGNFFRLILIGELMGEIEIDSLKKIDKKYDNHKRSFKTTLT